MTNRKNRTWQYREEKNDERVIISEEEIIETFWNEFIINEKKFGRNPKKTDLAKDECVYLWAARNWAERIK